MMSKTLSSIAVAGLMLAGGARADRVAPPAFLGTWVGQATKSYAVVNPSDPNALECIPNNGTIAVDNVKVRSVP
jgi:hypothetical protein